MFDPHRYPDGSKKRRHHNTKGSHQIRRGYTVDQVQALAKRLGIPYVTRTERDQKQDENADRT
jgi:hypothetical protein